MLIIGIIALLFPQKVKDLYINPNKGINKKIWNEYSKKKFYLTYIRLLGLLGIFIALAFLLFYLKII